MKKVFIYFIVILIVYLSFCIPNILFDLEDLKMESTSYKKNKIASKIDIQVENIYLVKAIHDIQDGVFNIKFNNYSKETVMVESSNKTDNKVIKYLIDETKKMQEYNVLGNLLEKYKDIDFKYYIYEREYGNLKKEYLIYRIVFLIDNYELAVEIEEKTGKIIYYGGIPKNNDTEELNEEEILRNYVKYLDLYIIDDWKFENNMLISEKAKLMVCMVYYNYTTYFISINSMSNDYLLEIYKN